MSSSQQSDTESAPLLSVVIPVYNEVATIERTIEAVRSVDVDHELIIVDDHSTDGTRARLESLAATDRALRVLYQGQNRGKGAALRAGFELARGRFVVIQDADLEYDPAQLPMLLEPLLDDRADVVFGSRFSPGDCRRALTVWQSAGNRWLTRLSNLLTGLKLSDMETCYKMFRREIIQDVTLEEDRFGFEPEFTAKIAAYRRDGRPLRICEVGIRYTGRAYSEGKKIGLADGLRAVWCILKYNLLR